MPNSRSPNFDAAAPSVDAAISRTAAASALASGAGSPMPALKARPCTDCACASAGIAFGTASSSGVPGRSSFLSSSQLRSTSSAPSTTVSPKTCGWRRTSFAAMPWNTSSIAKSPVSSATCACSTICINRSPSSSARRWGSPASSASSVSYASSSRKRFSVSCVCSRSHGQPPSGARSCATIDAQPLEGTRVVRQRQRRHEDRRQVIELGGVVERRQRRRRRSRPRPCRRRGRCGRRGPEGTRPAARAWPARPRAGRTPGR